jgi:preprotein translocase subunit Sec61beta
MGSISRVHTFASGAVLTAAQLNNEFDNLLTSSAINGGLDASNLGVTAGQVTASKALVVDSSRDLDDTSASNQVNNLTLSGTLKLADNKALSLGSNDDITIQYDETTNDALEIAAAVEGAAFALVLKADQGDDAGDEWKVGIADGGVLTFGNDIASAGSYVTGLTLTPHATTTSWVTAIAGQATIGSTLGVTGLVTASVGIDVKNGSSSAGFVKFYEDSDNGSNAVTLIGPASTADVTLTLPNSADTLVGKATTDTLTNKTLTTPVINVGSDATGDIYYRSSGGAFVRLAVGSNGQVLKLDSGIPAWGAASSGDISGSVGSTDNAVPRANGTGGSTVQASSVIIDDSNNISGAGTIGAAGGSSNGVVISQGDIAIKNGGTQSTIKFYCESSNAHYAQIQAPAHSAFSGDVTLTLPASTDTLAGIAATQTFTNKTLTTPTLTTPIANAGIQLKNGATSAGFLEFFEDSDNGTNKVTLIGPASTADITLTLPNSDGDADQVLTTNGSGVMSWQDAGGGAYNAWAVKTTTYTASSGDQLIGNHASSAFTITLPSSPSAGNSVTIKNVGAATITVGRNSEKINSAAEDGTLLENAGVQLVYVDSTIGWASL